MNLLEPELRKRIADRMKELAERIATEGTFVRWAELIGRRAELEEIVWWLDERKARNEE